MGETPSSADAERELNALRARAYGPNADIHNDPVALARLSEMESARLATEAAPTSAEPAAVAADLPVSTVAGAAADVAVAETGPPKISAGEPRRSLWRRATATRSRSVWLVTGAVVVVLALTWTIDRLLSPRPDSTLAPMAEEADGQILDLVDVAQTLDTSTLRGYEAYRGLEVWFARIEEGLDCLLAIERVSDSIITANCAPREAELRLEVGGYPESDEVHYEDGLTPGSVIRFTLNGDTMDVFLFPAAASE